MDNYAEIHNRWFDAKMLLDQSDVKAHFVMGPSPLDFSVGRIMIIHHDSNKTLLGELTEVGKRLVQLKRRNHRMMKDDAIYFVNNILCKARL